MLLYFLRHASAGKTILNPKKDERRALDEEGILQARYIGRLLANLDVQVDQIISSPLKRARQTASLVANELAFEAAVQIDDALRPDADFDQFQAMLARHKKYDAIMVVGSRRSDFPTAAQRLLLGIAANEATIALHRWHAGTMLSIELEPPRESGIR